MIRVLRFEVGVLWGEQAAGLTYGDGFFLTILIEEVNGQVEDRP